MYTIAALYQFTELNDVETVRDRFKNLCTDHGIKGTLIFAEEGVNGTVAGTRTAIDALRAAFDADGRFTNLTYKESEAEEMPFFRMKLKLKNEIVTLRVPGAHPHKAVGEYVDPKDWNALISDPDVLLIDTRNDYEFKIGAFKNTINPEIDVFVDFPRYIREELNIPKDKKIATFCTGGIRCEKATSFLKQEGFENVYHLNGGILKYLEEIPEEESLWEGQCFVFDQRVSVGHRLEQGDYTMCFGCRMPLSAVDRASEHYIEGVQCHHCHESMTDESRHANFERQKQILIAKERNEKHLGR